MSASVDPGTFGEFFGLEFGLLVSSTLPSFSWLHAFMVRIGDFNWFIIMSRLV